MRLCQPNTGNGNSTTKRQITSDTPACITDPQLLNDTYELALNISRQFMSWRKIDLDSVVFGLRNGCEFYVYIDYKTNNDWLYVTIAVVVTLVLLLLVGLFLFWFFRRLSLSTLPNEVKWQYQQYQNFPQDWVAVKTFGPTFFQKKLDKDSDEWKNLESLLLGTSLADLMNIKEVYAVFNQILISSFCNTYQILCHRSQKNPTLFMKKTWVLSSRPEEKKKVFDFYKERASHYSWNNSKPVDIFPLIHGTDFPISQAIASTGFASLSSLDAGWYGRGIYFTSFLVYALPYCLSRKDPALIISFVTLGNVNPICEHPQKEGNYVGKAIEAGYHSHYVCVDNDGYPPSKLSSTTKVFDEVVVSQEAQIAPVYIIRLLPQIEERSLGKKRRRFLFKLTLNV
eukprot:TRINITY_DN10725_c0_g2_i7.p1 TRINITY_DN10725_c0_g2~~TRINITY_DN10725_c0_g2_i7.p1  ORF type:complete len:398 (+),score=69.59 TRINITY_DN10725_c0_g2_i7:1019-2212(+)